MKQRKGESLPKGGGRETERMGMRTSCGSGDGGRNSQKGGETGVWAQEHAVTCQSGQRSLKEMLLERASTSEKAEVGR